MNPSVILDCEISNPVSYALNKIKGREDFSELGWYREVYSSSQAYWGGEFFLYIKGGHRYDRYEANSSKF